MYELVETLPTTELYMPYYWHDPHFTLSIYFKQFMYDEVCTLD
jgi:hypothetical protein